MDKQIENILSSLTYLISQILQDDNYQMTSEAQIFQKMEYDPQKNFETIFITDDNGDKYELTIKKVG